MSAIDSDEGGQRELAEPIQLSDTGVPVTGPAVDKAARREYLNGEFALVGNVSVEEAIEISGRYHASHYRDKLPGRERARYTIPANPRRDDDIRLTAFIARADRAFALVKRMRVFIHKDAGVQISDPAEFEAIDGEIATLDLESELD